MNSQLAIVLGLLSLAVVMFAVNKPRMDAVALIMLTVLPLTGVITVQEALSGFSDPSIVLIGALFVVGEGLVRTGVAQRIGDWLMLRAGQSEGRLMALLMAAVGCLGAFMSSTGVVAIFIPIAQRIAKITGAGAGRLMMPLSVAALISGMMTLIATAPNLVVNSELIRAGHEGFSFFSFTPFGLPVLVLGIGYMLWTRRWLDGSKVDDGRIERRFTVSHWVERYKLPSHAYRLKVGSTSSLLGKALADAGLRKNHGLNVVVVERPARAGGETFAPDRTTLIQASDILLVNTSATPEEVAASVQQLDLEVLPLVGTYFSDHSQDIGMVEVMVSADSDLIGRTVVDAGFRTRYGLTVIGLRRGRLAVDDGLLQQRLTVGDTLLLVGPWQEIKRLPRRTDDVVVLNLPAELDNLLPVTGKAPQALFAIALMVGLMVTGVVSNVQAVLIACLVLGLFRCIDLDSAYRSVHWKSLILIVGMLPFSVALQKTGGVELAAGGLMKLVGGAGPYALLASLFLITAGLGLFISNTATAVLMAPVAMAVARDAGVSPYPFAMIVALAASAAFMTPVSSPVNTLVVGPGNYRFFDFVRIGVPFTLVVLGVSVLLVPWLLPLQAR